MQHRLQRFVGWLGVACGLSAAIRAKVEHPFRVIKRQSGTLGTKGVGELGTIRATTAVVNAVVDALAHGHDGNGLGSHAERVQMPLTSQGVWQALQGWLPAPFASPP